jgi:hypothetical protein
MMEWMFYKRFYVFKIIRRTADVLCFIYFKTSPTATSNSPKVHGVKVIGNMFALCTRMIPTIIHHTYSICHYLKTMNAVSQQNAIDTKAVVIMYGWFGAASKNLKKYAELYINHPQNKCAVVYGTVDKPTIITRNDAKLAAMVMDSVRKAVEIIRNVESAATDGGKDIPVVLHYFSNGGAFIVENLG